MNANEEIYVDVNITPTESTKKIIRTFSKVSSGESIFEEKEKNLDDISTVEGVKITKFKKTCSLCVDLSMQFSNNKLDSSIFSLNKSEDTLNFFLSKDKLKAFFEGMQDEDKEYLELLMAPSLQDTNMSELEYTSLIASAYGKKVARELLTSHIDFSFEVPTQIKSVEVSPAVKYEIKGKRALINIPITKVLVMNEPIEIIVKYGNR